MISTTIVRDFPGESGVVPCIVRVSTNATLAQIAAPGFLKSNTVVAGQEILPTDIIAISYSNNAGDTDQNIFIPIFSNGIITLKSTTNDGGIVPPLVLQAVNNSDDFIQAINTNGDTVLDVDADGNMDLTGTLTGANKPIVLNNTSIYVPPNAANGIINCTNSGAITIGLNAAMYNLPVGYSTTVYLSGSGTVSFFTGGSDTMTITPFSAMTQGSVARISLIGISGGNGAWAVDIVGYSTNFAYTNSSFSLTGPWASPFNVNLILSKTAPGGIVTMNLSGINQPISGSINSTPIQAAVPIPSAYFPKQLVYSACFLNYGTGGSALGSMNVTVSGNINIVGPDLGAPTFAGTSGVTTVGYAGITMSWIAAT